jgi:flagellar basal body-associated protein FliL
MENQNQSWPPPERKNIDLSDRLDDVIEQRQQGAYQEVERKKVIPLKKKKIYILIIIVSWLGIIIFSIFLLGNKNSQTKEKNISPEEFLEEYEKHQIETKNKNVSPEEFLEQYFQKNEQK